MTTEEKPEIIPCSHKAGLFRSLKWLKLQGSKKSKFRASVQLGQKILRLQAQIMLFFFAPTL
ncbi:MAG: hypothetical protein RM021_022530, partial [Nostoc sp. EkiNYC01]|nr:hypothetical protein [Nostoc sp. EkiNYC01]